MADAGWTVAAMTTPGGLGAFLTGSAADMTGRVVPLGRVFAVDEPELVGQLCRTESEAARVDVLRAALVAAVRPERAEQARTVAATAALMETDRGLRCLGELAERSGIGTRTLQRLFHDYAGVSPTWVLRRYRLLDVAEAVRTGRRVVWSEVATELGYADQAHLIRDFRAATGGTPAAYQAAIARSRPD
jgi:transcriptional regulator GlxA family with amidase domain